MKKWRDCLWLFFTNLFISAFTFGGGYIVIPMVRKSFVLKRKILSEDGLLDIAAIAQSMPGAIAVNLVSLAGYKTAGMTGAFVSLIGSILPPLVILAAVSFWYDAFCANRIAAAALKGMEAAVAALIVDLVLDMYGQILKQKRPVLALLVPASFAASFFFGINAAFILIAGCVMTLLAWKIAAMSTQRSEECL